AEWLIMHLLMRALLPSYSLKLPKQNLDFMTKPIRGLYLAVTPNSLLGCFVLTPENIATLGKQQLSPLG
ncbi:hypothetical protein ACTNFO_004434, partial [Providencia stuartii]|uniref:hypothetical protein n=1 Tax=Providencia stuartii TaxID=588 RepID=UPI003886DDA4